MQGRRLGPEGQGADASPHLSGIPIIAKTHFQSEFTPQPPPGSAEGQGLGAPSVDRQGRLGHSVQEAGERLEGQEAGQMFAHRDGRGRLFSRQVQYSQCNGFLREGSLCAASRRSSGRAGGKVGQIPEPGLPLGIGAKPDRSRGQG